MKFLYSTIPAATLAALAAAPISSAQDRNPEIQVLSCPQVSFAADLQARPGNELVVEADSATLEGDGISELSGSVRLSRGDQLFSAEALAYDENQRKVLIEKESLFRNRNLIVRSQQAEFDLGTDTGEFHDTDFTLIARAARGTAERFTVQGDGQAQMQEVAYTTCAPGDDAWQIEASQIKLDHQSGLGSARNARLRFAGVPIIYMPWFQFPIDNRRRSGLLFPTLGESDRTGVDLRWPVYLNLAPNLDATVTPRVMTRRGVQLGTAFRYLLEDHQGQGNFEILPTDEVTGETRQLVDFSHEGLLNRRLALDAQFTEVSDRNYYEDFSGRLDATAITHLERSARLIYRAPTAYRIEAMIQDFQTIDSTLLPIDEPYKRLPRVTAEAQTSNTILNTRGGLNAEFVSFALDDAVEGQRLDLQPYLRFLRDDSAWYYGARADLRHTQYLLSGLPAGADREPSRTLPIVSADAGLRFERRTGSGWLQTLEPEAYYLHVPFKDQSDLPIFDSGEPDFDFVQLFARNRLSGVDRVADANHLASSLTSRLIDPVSGEVLLTASLGQVFRFEESEVMLPGSQSLDSGGTDFIAYLDYRLSDQWRGAVSAQWSPDQNLFNRTSTTLKYRNQGRRVDFGYRYRRGLLEQADIAAITPIAGRWQLAGRWRFSLEEDRSLEALVGVEYETCCWSVRGAWRRYLATTTNDFSSGIYVQLELKGLGKLGAGFQDLLPFAD